MTPDDLRDTSKSHREHVFATAAEAFANHVVQPICDAQGVKVFKCARPNTWTYGFFVSFLPGAILVHGDIGDFLIDRPSGGFDWLRNAIDSMDYVLSKSSMAKRDTFMPGDALALLDDPRWRDSGVRKMMREGWSAEDVSDGHAWRELLHDITGDCEAEPCCYYSFNTLFCYAALKWFFKTIAKAEAAA